MFRYRKNYKTFQQLTKDDDCALCNLKEQQIRAEDDHIYVVENKFPYDIWEYRTVIDHLLIVPKMHAAGIAELSEGTRLSILSYISRYEDNGYDVYARSVGSNMRSVTNHQHTHLIKTAGKPATMSVYVKKPYWVAKI